MRYSLAVPTVGRQERRAVLGALRLAEISRGRATRKFERAFGRVMGDGYAVSVVTGTAALEVAIRASGLEQQEVVTSAMSCQATANALLAARCAIRFADHDRSTWQVSAAAVADAITRKTRAIVIPHLYGNAADLTALEKIARVHRLPLIEDASQSFGARWLSRLVGTFGVASTFSFYANKLITTGEGGMLWTQNATVAQRATILRNHGQDSPFHHVAYGLNWKMPNLLAALGEAQLRRIKKLVAARVARMKLLRDLLSHVPELVVPVLPAQLEPAPFCFPVVCPRHFAPAMRHRLAKQGIETRPLFPVQFDQPYWKRYAPQPSGRFEVSRFLAQHGLYLPVSPHLTKRDLKQIAESVTRAVQE